MAEHRTSPARAECSGPVLDAEVTVLAGADERPLRDRIADAAIYFRRYASILLVLSGVGVTAALVAGSLHGRPASALPAARAQAHDRGAAGVAGAYGYALRCLSVTISRANPAYARADFDHRSECGRYTGEVTAIFHRTHGAWRTALDATAYRCPIASLPAAVQTELAVCPG
jgi:hypothetical protein